MKNISKIVGLVVALFTLNLHAASAYLSPQYSLGYKTTISEIAFCKDWACTSPFTSFSGSQLISISSSGITGGDFALVIPDSGIYTQIRIKLSRTWLLNGYGQESDGDWCATGSADVQANSTTAAANSAETSFAMQSSFFKAADHAKGNGVDALGKLMYGNLASQTSIGAPYNDRSEGVNIAQKNNYTILLRTDSSEATDFYLTTVLRGNYDFASNNPLSSVEFGIKVDETLKVITNSNCSFFPGEPIFDFVIQ